MEPIYQNYKNALLATREAQRELFVAETELERLRFNKLRHEQEDLQARFDALQGQIVPNLKLKVHDADTNYHIAAVEYEHAMRTTHWEGLNREVNGQIIEQLKRIADR